MAVSTVKETDVLAITIWTRVSC